MNKTAIIYFLPLLFLLLGCKEDKTYRFSGIYATSAQGVELHFRGNPDQKININPEPLIKSENFQQVQKEYLSGNDKPTLSIYLDEEGTERLREVTSRFVGEKLAIIINDRLLSAPLVQTTIPNGRITVSTISENEIDQILEEIE